MKLSDIKISEAFANSIPSEKKMNECRNNWTQWHRHLVLKENSVEEAEVKISTRRKKRWYRKNVEDWNVPHYRNEATTYVYGKHPNSNCDKEFMWRVPKSMTWFSENVQVGDSILCQTKFGIAPVIVTKVEVLDRCPVNFRVKKVAKCMIRRDGYTVEP